MGGARVGGEEDKDPDVFSKLEPGSHNHREADQ